MKRNAAAGRPQSGGFGSPDRRTREDAVCDTDGTNARPHSQTVSAMLFSGRASRRRLPRFDLELSLSTRAFSRAVDAQRFALSSVESARRLSDRLIIIRASMPARERIARVIRPA